LAVSGSLWGIENEINNNECKGIYVFNCLCYSEKLGFIGFLILMVLPDLNAQNIQVTGKVFDEQTNEALPGVNIMVEGTTVGTSSGAEGEFKLSVPASNDTLIFSFIGYQRREIPLDGRNEVQVALAPEAIAGG